MGVRVWLGVRLGLGRLRESGCVAEARACAVKSCLREGTTCQGKMDGMVRRTSALVEKEHAGGRTLDTHTTAEFGGCRF